MTEQIRGLTLSKMPTEIRSFLIDEQAEMKKKVSGFRKQVSLETTIYSLIKTHPKFLSKK